MLHSVGLCHGDVQWKSKISQGNSLPFHRIIVNLVMLKHVLKWVYSSFLHYSHGHFLAIAQNEMCSLAIISSKIPFHKYLFLKFLQMVAAFILFNNPANLRRIDFGAQQMLNASSLFNNGFYGFHRSIFEIRIQLTCCILLIWMILAYSLMCLSEIVDPICSSESTKPNNNPIGYPSERFLQQIITQNSAEWSKWACERSICSIICPVSDA